MTQPPLKISKRDYLGCIIAQKFILLPLSGPFSFCKLSQLSVSLGHFWAEDNVF